MEVTPRGYSKETFMQFLHKNNVSDSIIEKFMQLPEKVVKRHREFKLYISSTWYDSGNTHYNFELNYYSEELVEYLFTYKIFTDIEKSVNFLLCELINNNYIAKPNTIK
jgi:uncharacterized protein (DUF1919 family)